jgi:hypothetical protein
MVYLRHRQPGQALFELSALNLKPGNCTSSCRLSDGVLMVYLRHRQPGQALFALSALGCTLSCRHLDAVGFF